MFYERHELSHEVWLYVQKYRQILAAKEELERSRASLETAIKELEGPWGKIQKRDQAVLQPPSSLAMADVQSLKPDGGSSYPLQAGG